MKKPTESQLEFAICQAITAQGHYVVKLKDQAQAINGVYRKGSSFQVRGISDLVVYLPNGIALWMEIKTEKGKQSEYQIAFQRKIESLGHKYVLVRSVNEATQCIGEALKTA